MHEHRMALMMGDKYNSNAAHKVTPLACCVAVAFVTHHCDQSCALPALPFPSPNSTHLFKAGSYPEGDVDQDWPHTGLFYLFKHFGQSTHCLHGDEVLRILPVIHPCHERRQDSGGELGHLREGGSEEGGRGESEEGREGWEVWVEELRT